MQKDHLTQIGMSDTTLQPASSIELRIGKHHQRRYRAYAWKQTAKMIGVISLGLIGLLFLSIVLLFR